MLAPLFPRPRPAQNALIEHLLSFSQDPQPPNAPIMAMLMTGWALGYGVLPFDLGLGAARFTRFTHDFFPGLRWEAPSLSKEGPTRHPEFADMLCFLEAEAACDIQGSSEMALIVAIACMGSDHLWQDLGLPSRAKLSELMALNFPALAHANRHDMKWKKFLYRELCQREGIYVCASPSCEACKDHALCFGPEH